MKTADIKEIQRLIGVEDDGAWGPKSQAACVTYLRERQAKAIARGIRKPPKDNDSSIIDVFGMPGQKDGHTPTLEKIKPPFALYYGGAKVKTISVHWLIAEQTLVALHYLSEQFPSEKERAEAGVSIYDGCYNPRKMRGSSSRLSRHSWAIALDFDAGRNGNMTKWPERAMMPFRAMVCWANAGFMPAGPIWQRDAMHVQYTLI